MNRQRAHLTRHVQLITIVVVAFSLLIAFPGLAMTQDATPSPAEEELVSNSSADDTTLDDSGDEESAGDEPETPAESPADVAPDPAQEPADESEEAVEPEPEAADEAIAPAEMTPEAVLANWAGCALMSERAAVKSAEQVRFACGEAIGSEAYRYRASISAPTAGWRYQINNQGDFSESAGLIPGDAAGSLAAFTIDLQPTSRAAYDEPGMVTVKIEYCDVRSDGCDGRPWQALASATLAASVVPPRAPSADDLTLICDADQITSGVGETSTINCTVTGRDSLETAATLSALAISAPTGWSLAADDGQFHGASLTVQPEQSIDAGEKFGFSFTAAPACSANGKRGGIAIATTLAHNGEQSAGPGMTIAASFVDETTVTTSITASSLDLAQQFSFEDQIITSSLTYRVTVTGCGAWGVSLAATDFVYSGNYGGMAIPASNITLASSSFTGGEPASGIAAAQTGNLGAPVVVLSGDGSTGPGVYEQTLSFNVLIPGGAPVGSYQTMLSIEPAAAFVNGEGKE